MTKNTQKKEISLKLIANSHAIKNAWLAKGKNYPVLFLTKQFLLPDEEAPIIVDSSKIDGVILKGKQFLATVCLSDNETLSEGIISVGQIATLSEVGSVKKIGDAYAITILGIKKMAITQIAPSYKGDKASAREIDTQELALNRFKKNEERAFASRLKLLKRLAQKMLKMMEGVTNEALVKLDALGSPEKLMDYLTTHLSLSFEEKYNLFSELSLKSKLEDVIRNVAQEIELSQVSSRIQEDVALELQDSQRRFYLTEQLKAIKRELGDGELGEPEIEEFEALARSENIPKNVKDTLKKELDRLAMLGIGSPEYAVSFNYLCTLRDLPWTVPQETKKSKTLKSAAAILEKSHFGQNRLKERIIEYLAIVMHTGQAPGQILLLNGPPGVGKTSFVRSIAEALGKPFVRISLGGIKDEAELRGHRRAYIGAMPGKIVQALIQAKSPSCVILLDEIDKVNFNSQGDMIGPLLEILDREHNHEFVDHYLAVPINLSRIIFVATANDSDALPQPLKDRMETIEVSGYTEEEKCVIAAKYLLPKIASEYQIPPTLFRVSDSVLLSMIRFYTREAGVRELKRELETIGRKVIRYLLESKKKIAINRDTLSQFLGVRKYIPEPDNAYLPIGVAVGLAYTGHGGDILIVETRARKAEAQKGSLTITGSLGTVMQESVKTAVSYLASIGPMIGEPDDWFAEHITHVHFPDGATPKDGPSAGIAILSALASQVLQKKLPEDLAMTGELSLRGKVLAIGGVREKVLAAQRYGKKRVIIPRDNIPDLAELPRKTLAKIKIIPVSDATEVLKIMGFKFDAKGLKNFT